MCKVFTAFTQIDREKNWKMEKEYEWQFTKKANPSGQLKEKNMEVLPNISSYQKKKLSNL
jgi:hypothetical protein